MTAVTEQQKRLLTLCAIRVDNHSIDWSLLAREATRPDGLDGLYDGRISERSKYSEAASAVLSRGLIEVVDDARLRVESELGAIDESGARLTTVLDEDYPANLRLIHNLPPFLFIRGDGPSTRDLRSVCVVGTRNASELGIKQAKTAARRLAENGVTVVSGLARGVDTAAHTATLDAGGRTIAVIGTGITRTYPKENAELTERIVESGAVVSQFWPTASPASWSFPRRNVVMSGIAQGTLVIEASKTSGAKMQARLALEHGKHAFLIRSLVTNQPWAANYVATRGAIEVDDADNVLQYLVEPERLEAVAEQRRTLAQLDLGLG